MTKASNRSSRHAAIEPFRKATERRTWRQMIRSANVSLRCVETFPEKYFVGGKLRSINSISVAWFQIPTKFPVGGDTAPSERSVRLAMRDCRLWRICPWCKRVFPLTHQRGEEAFQFRSFLCAVCAGPAPDLSAWGRAEHYSSFCKAIYEHDICLKRWINSVLKPHTDMDWLYWLKSFFLSFLFIGDATRSGYTGLHEARRHKSVTQDKCRTKLTHNRGCTTETSSCEFRKLAVLAS